jgi:predicted ribosomally synthesized peptide with SipW-like signal peptide
MTRTRKILLTMLVLGLAGTFVSLGAFSAFSDTTSNTGNQFTAGNVAVGDNDANAAMFANVTGGKPGTAVQRCIKVTYSGSLDADVKLYTTDSSIGTLATYTDVTIEKGSYNGAPPAFPGCTNFLADSGGTIYTGTLSNFRSTYSNYTNGIASNPGAAAKWVTNDSIVYRFTYTVQDNNSAQSQSTGSHSFTWEARNQ